jgi:hypothetical protein
MTPAPSVEQPRVLPYDLAFQDADFEQTHFPAIQAEAEQRAIDSSDAERFLQLHSVGGILRSALVESEDTAVAQFGPLLFQAYHFWRFGKRVHELAEPLFRHLVSADLSIGSWQLLPPAPSGYLSFPRHLLWARIGAEATPEAVDGLFWTMVGADDPALPPFARIDVLLVLGLRPGRPGFSVAEVGAHPGDEPHGHWGDAQARSEPQLDFANVLPGGELQQLHALETGGEVLKLVSRAFWYQSVHG